MKDESSIHEFKSEGIVLKNSITNIEVSPKMLKDMRRVVRVDDELWGDYDTREILEKLIIHKQKDKTMSESTPLQNFEIWLLKDGFSLESPGLLNVYDCSRSYIKADRLVEVGCGLRIIERDRIQEVNFYIRDCYARTFYSLDNSREYYERFMNNELIPLITL